MQNIRKIRCLLIFTIISFFIMSTDFLLMPISNLITTHNTRWIDILSGIVFWISLISAIVLCLFYIQSCQLWRKQNITDENGHNKRQIGLITFFSNPFSIVADAVMCISFFVFIMLMIFTDRTGFICYVDIAFLTFSFCMHCILNGKYFNALFINKNNK